MSPRRTPPASKGPIDEAREAGAWAPALRAVELLGRNIGLWRTDSREQETSLADLINEAVERSKVRDDGGG
jgi:hypothetical protein